MIEITEEQSSSFQNFKLLLHKEDNQKESPKVEVNKQPLVDFSPIQDQKYSEEHTRQKQSDSELKSDLVSIEESQHESENNQGKSRTQKSLEREFDKLAEEFPEELPTD